MTVYAAPYFSFSEANIECRKTPVLLNGRQTDVIWAPRKILHFLSALIVSIPSLIAL